MRRPWRLLCSCVLCACVWTSRNGQPRRRHRRWPSFTADVWRSPPLLPLLILLRKDRETKSSDGREVEDREIGRWHSTDSLLFLFTFLLPFSPWRHTTQHHLPNFSHSLLHHFTRQFPRAFCPPFTPTRRPETNVNWRSTSEGTAD